MWVPFLPEPDQAKNFAWLLLFVFFPGLICGQSELPEWLDGNFTLELQHFPGDAQDPRQENQNASIKLEFDFDNEWAGELRKVLYFSPFYRIDRSDKERTHFDLREFNLLTVGDSWDLRVGISKVFWGATEFVHWVDVINQTDFVENIDGEEKLGQPMVQFSIDREEGKFELYYLPYFRERTFPGVEGRPRIIPHVDPDQAKFENADAEQHPDFALRWSESFDDADVGLSHFYGTTREPTYLEGFDNGEPVLIPY
nr:hypothetical protein [Nitrospinaceae bacterium]